MLRVCQQLTLIVQNVEQSLLLLVTYAADLSLRAIKCCSVVFGITLNFLVINISPSFPAINKHCRLPLAKCHNLRDVLQRRCIYNTWLVAALTAGREARYRLRIAISANPTCIRRPRQGGSRRSIAMPFGMEKRKWCGYPMVINCLMICLFVLT